MRALSPLVAVVSLALSATACEPDPAAGPRIPIGQHGAGIVGLAVGDSGVWVASAGFDSFVAHVDPRRDAVEASVPLAGGVADVAAGAGGVWAAGAQRLRPCVWRIDPRSNQVVSTIALDPPPGVRPASPFPRAIAVGEGGVWLAVIWRATAGEVIRIDPDTEKVVARIPTDGRLGELHVGGGAIWAVSRSILRIDPSANTVVAKLASGRMRQTGSVHVPRYMAVGRHEAWVMYPRVDFATALRIDVETNAVTKIRLPLERFYPVGITRRGVWFVGHDGRNRGLGLLNTSTLEVERWIDPGVDVARAAYRNADGTFWFGSLVARYRQQAYVTRVSR